MKSTQSKRTRYLFAWFPPFVVVALLSMTLSECRHVVSDAKGETSNISCVRDFGVVNGEMDAGITVKVTVTNVGEAGFIRISAELSTSEGEWDRSQTLQFSKEESKALSYFFPEPTVNVDTNSIQCRVSVSPKADN